MSATNGLAALRINTPNSFLPMCGYNTILRTSVEIRFRMRGLQMSLLNLKLLSFLKYDHPQHLNHNLRLCFTLNLPSLLFLHPTPPSRLSMSISISPNSKKPKSKHNLVMNQFLPNELQTMTFCFSSMTVKGLTIVNGILFAISSLASQNDSSPSQGEILRNFRIYLPILPLSQSDSSTILAVFPVSRTSIKSATSSIGLLPVKFQSTIMDTHSFQKFPQENNPPLRTLEYHFWNVYNEKLQKNAWIGQTPTTIILFTSSPLGTRPEDMDLFIAQCAELLNADQVPLPLISIMVVQCNSDLNLHRQLVDTRRIINMEWYAPRPKPTSPPTIGRKPVAKGSIFSPARIPEWKRRPQRDWVDIITCVDWERAGGISAIKEIIEDDIHRGIHRRKKLQKEAAMNYLTHLGKENACR